MRCAACLLIAVHRVWSFCTHCHTPHCLLHSLSALLATVLQYYSDMLIKKPQWLPCPTHCHPSLTSTTQHNGPHSLPFTFTFTATHIHIHCHSHSQKVSVCHTPLTAILHSLPSFTHYHPSLTSRQVTTITAIHNGPHSPLCPTDCTCETLLFVTHYSTCV